jgi:hypothetical protein
VLHDIHKKPLTVNSPKRITIHIHWPSI